MPIKFFEPVNPRLPKEIMRVQDEFNVFEYKATDSIGKVYVTAYDNDDGTPQIMLWCHYKSKAEDIEEEKKKPIEYGHVSGIGYRYVCMGSNYYGYPRMDVAVSYQNALSDCVINKEGCVKGLNVLGFQRCVSATMGKACIILQKRMMMYEGDDLTYVKHADIIIQIIIVETLTKNRSVGFGVVNARYFVGRLNDLWIQ